MLETNAGWTCSILDFWVVCLLDLQIYKLYINRLPEKSESKWRTRTLSICSLKDGVHYSTPWKCVNSLQSFEWHPVHRIIFPPFLFWSLLDRVHFTLKMRQFPAVLWMTPSWLYYILTISEQKGPEKPMIFQLNQRRIWSKRGTWNNVAHSLRSWLV